ncbi:MAG: hypothetical protein IE909_14570 [Campylobacterales bacterium]|nr:hypothetical protein [Campylobacterales bacterium]
MLQDKYKNAVLLFAAFIILVLSFQFNFFGAATKSFFEGHQRDSESLVLGRIIETKNNGFLSNGGFLGRYASDDPVGFQYEAYVNDLVPESTFGGYRQSFGLQGYFYAVLDSGFSIFGVDSGSKRLFLSKLVTSSLLALLLVLFIYFVNQNFGIFTAFLTTALLATSQWLVVFSNNLYWMFFLIILPFIVVNSFLQFKSQGIFPSLEKRFYILYLLVFLAVFIKSLAGYEYISTILISTVVPLVFFAINDGWKLKTFFTRFVLVGLSGLAGFFTAIFVHLLQLANTLGSFSKGLEHLWYTVAKRTHGDPNTVDEVYRRSLESNVFDVILKYWNGRAFNLDSLLGYGGFLNFSSIIIFIIILTIIITSLSFLIKSMHTDRNKNLAMIAALWFSISAPLSWHLLAKGHSFIHGHMNHVLWYIPFLLIGFAYIGYGLCLLFKNFKFFSLPIILKIVSQ